ncbi:hypothetical protein [Massilia sp. H6]|uniref:hypothetical protein n=1 Tax=Massilia sp. H6 TaxID=2970464 RepID=UPI002167F9AF|nr:hypothetical protein [Massilia sp. H6]UVW27526.1 hypothetical protein NRS07_13330 [Massilia sp. H6]
MEDFFTISQAGEMTSGQVAKILLYLGEQHGLAPCTDPARLWIPQLQLTIADLAIRIGALPVSTHNERRLSATRLRVLAAPAYLARYGAPVDTASLPAHRTLGVTASSGETVRHLALAGAGIASLADFLTQADVAARRLVCRCGRCSINRARWRCGWRRWWISWRGACRGSWIVEGAG